MARRPRHPAVAPCGQRVRFAGAPPTRFFTEGEEPKAVPRDDGSWLLAGWMPADEMADQLGITLPPKREYQTVAGFLLAHLGHLPAVGEHVTVSGWRFEVVDLDRRRIDKVMASRVPVTRRQL